MSQVALSFPDETYSSSNKPSVLTLKADLTAIETAHNDTDTNAVTLTGTQVLTNKTLTLPNFTNGAINFNAPQGFLINGKISVTDTGSGLNVALKTLAGTDPSATDPIYVRLNDSVRTISQAISVTCADGTNWFNAGSAELATKEIDYFVYLIWNSANSRVSIAFSRVPYYKAWSEVTDSNTNEKNFEYDSNFGSAAANDECEVVGRFAATLSAGAGYTWSVPTYTAANLIQRPIYETRLLSWAPTFTGFSVNPTGTFVYRILNDRVELTRKTANSGTSNTTGYTFTCPFSFSEANFFLTFGASQDNGVNVSTPAYIANGAVSNVATCYKSWNTAIWTAANSKDIFWYKLNYQI